MPKQGAGYGYTRKLGYHPILATRADTGEVLHVRLRKGSANTQRGALRFVDELIARVRRAGATGQILLRADSGFWNKKVIARLREHGCAYSIGVTLHQIVTAQIALIAEDAWQPVADYPDSGEARSPRRRSAPSGWSSAACTCTPRRAGRAVPLLAPLRVHHQPHRSHRRRRGRAPPARRRRARHPRPQRPGARALPLRPLQRQQRLDRDRVPRAQPLPLERPARPPRPHAARRRTLRRRLFALPGRLTRTARRWTLHLPARWPWAQRLHRRAHPHPRAPTTA